MARLTDSTVPKVAIVLPNRMAIRNMMETPVLDLLVEQRDLVFTLLTHCPDSGERISELGVGHLQWADVSRPASNVSGLRSRSRVERARGLVYQLLMRCLRGKAEFGNLVFRFNHLHQFAGHRHKIDLSPERRRREAMAGNFVDRELGKPLPNSWLLFRTLYWLYYSTWQPNNVWVEAFFDQFRPNLLVLSHIQNEVIRPYSVAARRRKLPTLGIVGSWDQPTTKGPVCPGIRCYLVQSQAMRQELMKYHQIAGDNIEVIGWPQMDSYQQPGVIQSREVFLDSIGVPLNKRLLVFATYSTRLGRHEPGIVRYLAEQLDKGAYGEPCTLLIRPHPNDSQWEARFGALHAPPDVIVQPAEWGRLNYLANLLYHADVLLASSGTIALDAIALDTCVVNIAFDGDLKVDYRESIRRWYEMDHYVPLVQSGGTWLVGSYGELDQAIITYLQDPDQGRAGRERLRREQLEPLDGRASQRLVKLIVDEARQSAQCLRQGD